MKSCSHSLFIGLGPGASDAMQEALSLIGKPLLRNVWILFFIAFGSTLWSQTTDSTSNQAIDVLSMRKSVRVLEPTRTIDYFYGDVVLKHEDTYIYCDTATLEGKVVHAWGNVIIRQGDTLAIFSDLLHYDGTTRLAELDNRVVLKNREYQLFTERLVYDVQNKIATYQQGATLNDGKTILRSRQGKFLVEQDDMYFTDQVEIVDPEFRLKTDSLRYGTDLKIARFIAPTIIVFDSAQIYTESGYYNIERKRAYFDKNPQYKSDLKKARAQIIEYDGQLRKTSLIGEARYEDDSSVAKADTMHLEEGNNQFSLLGNAYYKSEQQEVVGDRLLYDRARKRFQTSGRSRITDKEQVLESDSLRFDDEKGLGIAKGQVIWQDTVQQTAIFSEVLEQQRESEYVKAYGGRPLLRIRMDEQFLYIAGDTLISKKVPAGIEEHAHPVAVDSLAVENTTEADSIQVKPDSIKVMLMYGNVQIYREDLRGVCDSLVFQLKDSVITMYDAPVMWSDSTQFSADTIRIKAIEGKIHQIHLVHESMVIMTKDQTYFDQIKGKMLEVSFDAGKVNEVDVSGNAQTVYYVRDAEEAYVGVNNKKAGTMKVWLADNQVGKVRFYGQPDGNFSSMGQTDHDAIKIPGFKWEWPKRPGHPSTMSDLNWIDWSVWFQTEAEKQSDAEDDAVRESESILPDGGR
jgi:lipopolysaccharide export system protein LptA